VEGDDDCDADDGHVNAEAEVGEEGYGRGRGLVHWFLAGNEGEKYFVHSHSDLLHRYLYCRRGGARVMVGRRRLRSCGVCGSHYLNFREQFSTPHHRFDELTVLRSPHEDSEGFGMDGRCFLELPLLHPPNEAS